MAQLLMIWLVLLGGLFAILAGAATGLMLAGHGSSARAASSSAREWRPRRTGRVP